jgi:hypothetical protein
MLAVLMSVAVAGIAAEANLITLQLAAKGWLDASSPPCRSLTEIGEQQDEQPEYEEPEFNRPVASQCNSTQTSPRSPVECFRSRL